MYNKMYLYISRDVDWLKIEISPHILSVYIYVRVVRDIHRFVTRLTDGTLLVSIDNSCNARNKLFARFRVLDCFYIHLYHITKPIQYHRAQQYYFALSFSSSRIPVYNARAKFYDNLTYKNVHGCIIIIIIRICICTRLC